MNMTFMVKMVMIKLYSRRIFDVDDENDVGLFFFILLLFNRIAHFILHVFVLGLIRCATVFLGCQEGANH